MPRITECGHVFCLICALKHLQSANSCAICGGGPLLFSELRPVRLELQTNPAGCLEAWTFKLVRRTGDWHIGLAEDAAPAVEAAELPKEGSPGWRFARRVQGCPDVRLDFLHAELRAMEGKSLSSDLTSLLRPAMQQLRQELCVPAAPAGGPPSLQAPDVVVFYQSDDGQLLFLEPSLTKQLLGRFHSWSALPRTVKLRLQKLRAETLTDELRRRHRFLKHLRGQVTFADGQIILDEPMKPVKSNATQSEHEQHEQHEQHESGISRPVAQDAWSDDD